MEDEEKKVVTDNAEELPKEDVQKQDGKSAIKSLRQQVIEKNQNEKKLLERIEQLEKGSTSSVPQSAIDAIKQMSDSPETADVMIKAFQEMSKSEIERFMKERDSLKTNKEREMQVRELEAEQAIEEQIEKYETLGVKITSKEITKRIQEEYGDDGDEVEVDSRAIKLIAKLLFQEKKEAFSKDAESRKNDIKQTEAAPQKGVADKITYYNPKTGKIITR